MRDGQYARIQELVNVVELQVAIYRFRFVLRGTLVLNSDRTMAMFQYPASIVIPTLGLACQSRGVLTFE